MRTIRRIAGIGLVVLVLVSQACRSVPSPEALYDEATRHIHNIEKLERRIDRERSVHTDLLRLIEERRAARRTVVRRLDSLATQANALKDDIDSIEGRTAEKRRMPDGLHSVGPADSRRLFLKGDELFHMGELELARQYLSECYRKADHRYDYDLHALFRLGQISCRLGRTDHLAWVFMELQKHEPRFFLDAGRVQVYRGFGKALPPGTIDQLKVLDRQLRGLRGRWSTLKSKYVRIRGDEYEPINGLLVRSVDDANEIAEDIRSAANSLSYVVEQLRAVLEQLKEIIQGLTPRERAPYERVVDDVRNLGSRLRHFPQI